MAVHALVGCAPPVTEIFVLAETDLVRSDPETPPVGDCTTLPPNVDECEMRLVKIDIVVPGDPGAPTGLTTLVGRQRSELFQLSSKLALFPKIRDPDSVKIT